MARGVKRCVSTRGREVMTNGASTKSEGARSRTFLPFALGAAMVAVVGCSVASTEEHVGETAASLARQAMIADINRHAIDELRSRTFTSVVSAAVEDAGFRVRFNDGHAPLTVDISSVAERRGSVFDDA